MEEDGLERWGQSQGGWGGDSYKKATEAYTREEAVEREKGEDVIKRM